jgi:hypothetical protein
MLFENGVLTSRLPHRRRREGENLAKILFIMMVLAFVGRQIRRQIA